MLRHYCVRHCCGTVTDPSQGFAYRLGAVYIDVSFLLPSSAPQLDILVEGQSNCIGLYACYAVLVPRLTEFVTLKNRCAY